MDFIKLHTYDIHLDTIKVLKTAIISVSDIIAMTEDKFLPNVLKIADNSLELIKDTDIGKYTTQIRVRGLSDPLKVCESIPCICEKLSSGAENRIL